MLKAVNSSCFRSRLHNLAPSLRPATESESPLLRVLGSLRGLGGRSTRLTCRAFFCSDANDASSRVAEIEAKVKEEDVEVKSSSAIVPTNPRPEDYLTVGVDEENEGKGEKSVSLYWFFCLIGKSRTKKEVGSFGVAIAAQAIISWILHANLCKGIDPKLLAALQESRRRHAPYAGAFLLKDEPGTDSNVVSGSEAEKNTSDLSGKELYDRLHEVGTLAQISSIQGDQVVLIGHRRLRITEMVSEDPLTVKVDHLKDKPYNKDADVIKATSFEVISTLRDVLKTSSLWRDHVQTYTQHIGDFNFPRLADFGAAISGANKLECQQVLEELDVDKRLKFTLELLKKEMEINRIQESIAKAIEEKISGEQRRYLLNEQLKAIKKELGLETDDKTALSGEPLFCEPMVKLASDDYCIGNSCELTWYLIELTIKKIELPEFVGTCLIMNSDVLSILENVVVVTAPKFRERLEPVKDKCPPHVAQVIEEELAKLQLLEASSSEFNVTRNYLDWLTVLPWGVYSDENFDVLGAQKILDEDHYGLTDVKERILEFIAVGKLRGSSQGFLCPLFFFIVVKEKTIAARRSEVKTIIFPSANRRDFDELASNVKEGLDVHFVDEYSQIFNLAFEDKSEIYAIVQT
uniref:Lon N-terminal domain-containing protein n=1 Tax=Cucumis melo TaxID=3656 RepID=A0A9I9CIM1_CUCME